MKRIKIPSEKFVEYTDNGFALIQCAICETRNMTNVIALDGLTSLHCSNDKFNAYIRHNSEFDATVDIFQYDFKHGVKNMLRVITKLFNLGIIGNATYIELRVHALENFKGSL